MLSEISKKKKERPCENFNNIIFFPKKKEKWICHIVQRNTLEIFLYVYV